MSNRLLYNKNLLDVIDQNCLPGFYEIESYPFLFEIEKNFQIIKTEFELFDSKQDFFKNWTQHQMTNGQPEKWQVMPVSLRTNLYNQADKFKVCGNFFPKTLSILEQAVKENLCDVMFSNLQPNTKLNPHHGQFHNSLRCHLAITVPKGDCGITVNGQTRNWIEGKILIFNEALEHTAWNFSDKERVVLIFDFIPDNYKTFFPTESENKT
jgi:aspartyl/asparaginyl beta-hydroxylase (cupin superfamily)